MCETSVSTRFCPYCQMPLGLLRLQNVNLHLEVCYRKQSSKQSLSECPKGIKCNSSMICHYERYSHDLIAQKRSNNLCEIDIGLQQSAVLSMLGQSQKDTGNESSMDDFLSDVPSSMKRNTWTIKSKNRISPKNRKTSKNFFCKRKNKCDVPISSQIPKAAKKDVPTPPHMDNTESDSLNNSTNLASTVTSGIHFDSLPTDDSADWPQLSPRGPGFVPHCSPGDKTGDPLENYSFSTDLPSDAHQNTCSGSSVTDIPGEPFTNLSFGATSTQLTSNQENTDSTHESCSDSLLPSPHNVPDKSKNNDVVEQKLPKKRKQGDIGAMMFGLKPLTKAKEAVIVSGPQQENEILHTGRKRQCPFYKKVQGTDIAVDAFNYGPVPGINFYFLSHFHYDHYIGLTKKFQADIYCSHVTGNLVETRLKLPRNQIKRLPMKKKMVVGDVEVTLLEANHCPGSVLLLFKLRNGQTVLHTGDFRADAELQNNNIFYDCHINILYLDTTYLDPNYAFPSQKDVLSLTSCTVHRILASNEKTLVVTGTYCIGKEKIFLEIARKLKCKVCVTKEKMKILKCLDDEDMDEVLTTQTSETNLHVLPMNKLNPANLQNYLNNFIGTYDQIIAIKPTGWTHKGVKSDVNELQPKNYGAVKIYGVPYSEHSSFIELKEFVQAIKPDRIIPTINVGRADTRKMMEGYLNTWKKR